MTIPFHCPQCNAFTEVDVQFAGQTGPCASCGKTVTIPSAPFETRNSRRKTGGQRAAARRRVALLGVVGVVVLALSALGVLLAVHFRPSVVELVQEEPESLCHHNIQLVANAILSYEEIHGTLPPAFSTDADGNPLLSWRVLILPHLGYESLYRDFHIDEPWDSDHNKSLILKMPKVFECTSNKGLNLGETSYMVINGEGMLFHNDALSSSAGIADGADATILLVEVADAQVSWTDPQDIDAARMSWNINRDDKGIGSFHDTGVHVVMADGEVYCFADILPAAQLRAMATTDGGEVVVPSQWAE